MYDKAIGTDLHNMLDATRGKHKTKRLALLTLFADDIENSGIMGAAETEARSKAQQAGSPSEREFWQRLAGSLKKAAEM